MKKIFGNMMAAILVVGLMDITGFAFVGSDDAIAAGPVLATATPLVKMGKRPNVVLMGSGFKPGQELRIIFTFPDGLESDIGHALKPEPVPDKAGTWSTTWNARRLVSRKMIKAGAHKIVVTDADYNPIAHTAVIFQEVKKEAEKNTKKKKKK